MITHSLLSSQISKTIGDEANLSPEIKALLDLISQTYCKHDTDREFFNETMELTNKELTRVNEILQGETIKKAVVLDNLKKSIESLNIEYYDHDLSDEDLLSLSNILAEQIAMRNLAEALLMEQDESLRIIIEGTKNFVIYSINNEGYITNWNSSAERITGYSSEEAIGRHFSMFFVAGENTPEKAEQMLEKAVSKGNFTYEGFHNTKDGERFWGETTLTPIFYDCNSLKGFVSVTLDISERKAEEEELRKAKEEAEAATRAKSEFLANMSHEIRTPMNGVIGMASLLMDTTLNDEQEDYVQVIRSSGESLLSIINDILDFSKIEAGQIEIEEYPFCLRTCIEEACDLVSNRLRSKNVELIYRLSHDTPPRILSDPTRLRQIIINLLSNAVKFTTQGEVVVSTCVAEEREDDLLLQVSVRDTGIGIPKDKIGRLFNAFSQVDASTTRKFGGTGLGLSICSQLSRLMGGDIWVESEEGEGSTFHFTIAVKRAEEVAPTPPISDLADKHILLIEDNETLCEVLREQFAKHLAHVTTLNNAPEALQWMQEHKCDLVIIDNRLLEPDKPLQNWLSRKNNAIPILVLTPIGERISHHHDNVSVLQKPIKTQVFFEKVAGILETASLQSIAPKDGNLLADLMHLKILIIEENPLDQRILNKMLAQYGHEVRSAATEDEIEAEIQHKPFDVVFFDVDARHISASLVFSHFPAHAGSESPIVLISSESPDYPDHVLPPEAAESLWITKPINLANLQQSLLRLASKLPIQQTSI